MTVILDVPRGKKIATPLVVVSSFDEKTRRATTRAAPFCGEEDVHYFQCMTIINHKLMDMIVH